MTFFKWGLLATVLAGLAVWMYVKGHVDDEIRQHAEALLASRFPRLAVSVDSARLVEGEGIYLRGLRLRQPGDEDNQSALATIDEVFLECDTSLQRLVHGDVRLRR